MREGGVVGSVEVMVPAVPEGVISMRSIQGMRRRVWGLDKRAIRCADAPWNLDASVTALLRGFRCFDSDLHVKRGLTTHTDALPFALEASPRTVLVQRKVRSCT